jgi:DNA-binding PadR family transcriptional regulator
MIHNEKNVFDNMFNLIMDVKGKTNDNLKARPNVEILYHRLESRISTVANRRGSIPKAYYTLTTKQKRILLEWMKDLQLPDGFASNLG